MSYVFQGLRESDSCGDWPYKENSLTMNPNIVMYCTYIGNDVSGYIFAQWINPDGWSSRDGLKTIKNALTGWMAELSLHLTLFLVHYGCFIAGTVCHQIDFVER